MSETRDGLESEAAVPAAEAVRPKRTTWKRRIGIVGIGAVAALLAVELFCRYHLGFGDPPLSMKDPQMAYVFKPSRTYHRFGHRIHYNAWSMRSDDFPEHKPDAGELRVMVIGDSVINGGVLTDQSEIATALLQKRLAEELRRKVVVGNISAGGWGPPNELAYVKKLGLFDADVLVIVLANHDSFDAPTFNAASPLPAFLPERTPWCATWEAVTRYLPNYLPGRSKPPVAPAKPAQADIDRCLAAAREMVDLARARNAVVVGALHLARAESNGAMEPGHDVIKAVFDDRRVPVVELGDAFVAAVRAGRQPYRDDIHPNELGQELIAQSLLEPIKKAAEAAAVTRPAHRND